MQAADHAHAAHVKCVIEKMKEELLLAEAKAIVFRNFLLVSVSNA